MRFGAMICRVVLVCVTGTAIAAPEQSPIGTWQTANGNGVVAIGPCGTALCGRIVGIERAPGEPMPTDVQGQSQCGLTIITDERPKSDGTWLGWVTDPRDGTTYHAELWVDAGGDLHLRGYIGVPLLGETQVWHRFAGRLTEGCGFVYDPI